MQWLAGNAALLSLGVPSGFEWIIILGFGLLIFGKRIPELGKNLSKGSIQFKNGLKGIADSQPSLSGPPVWLIVALASAVVCAWWVMRSK
jgi:TatA/E family protein of Tat protein translocase